MMEFKVNNWALASLGDLCEFEGGTQPPKKEFIQLPKEGYVRLLQIQDFKTDERAVYVPDKPSLRKCNETDILIGRYGASVGKILRGKSGAYNVAIVKTIPDLSYIRKDFLYYLLRSDRFQQFILSLGSRAAQAGFNKSEIQSFKFLLPPLDEQKEIVITLSKVDEMLQKRDIANRLIDDLLQTIFIKMFGQPVKNTKGWPLDSLGNCSTKITDGTHKTPVYTSSGIKFLSAKDITNCEINWDTKKFISIQEHKVLSKRCNPEIGDILLTKSGSIGSAALVDRNYEFSLFESLALIKYDKNKLNGNFLVQYLNNAAVRQMYSRSIKGISIKHLHLVDIKSLPVILPPIEIQGQFGLISEQLKRLKVRQKQSAYQLNSLFKSLMQRIFIGNVISN